MSDTWEMTVRAAATTMLRYPDKISDGLEAELYALLEQLDTAQAPQSEGTSAAMRYEYAGQRCRPARHLDHG